MKNQKKIELPGSHKVAHKGEATNNINREDTIEITVRLRRKKSIESLLKTGQRISQNTYEKQFGASKKDAAAVEAYAHSNNLSTVAVSLARRSIILTGKVADMEAAFGVTLNCSKDDKGSSYRVREGSIFVPVKLKDVIEGVFGLDNRPAARPMLRLRAANGDGTDNDPNVVQYAFTPDELAKVYGFPAGVDGSGECIGIIELDGGYRTEDLTAYFKSLGINLPLIKSISVDQGQNSPSNSNSADGEVMLDIEVAGAVAPGATIVVYFCPNTDQGFLDAITQAIHDTQNKPSVISISWGAAEINWTEQSLNSFNEAFKTAALLGVTICVAAGDNGSSDAVTDGLLHVDFPASSPYALACGGTSLTVKNGQIVSESVWHDSNTSAGGGGISDFFALPDYQANANVPLSINTKKTGRGVPDVAGDADPNTGYNILVDGQETVLGGTSAVAPLMAGLIARINQQKGITAGFINPTIYATPSLCRDIVAGNNDTTASGTGYPAGPGWDACTGLGVLSHL